MLADMAACSTKAWLRYYKKVTAAAQSSPAAAGVAVHAGLEAYWRTSNVDDGLTAFDDVYRAHADEFVPDDDRLSFNNVRRTLEVYFKRNPVETLPFRIRRDLVELPFSAQLSDNVVLVGQPDAIVETYDTGNLYILDHKTTGNANDMWKAKFKIAPQLTAYIWAAREQLGAPVEGAFINLIELRKIPSSTRKCPEHGVHYAECGPQHSKTELLGPILRSDQQIAQWKKMAVTIAERYRALILEHTDTRNCTNVPTEGIFHGACGFCEFQDYCYTGKNPALESMFVPSVYDPYKGMIPTE